MVVVNASLNCEDKDYQFNLSAVTDADCEEFAIKYVFQDGKTVKGTHINGIKVIIRDNIAKVQLYYQEGASIHEVAVSLDPFGMKSHNYEDEISRIWQTIMARHFGQSYVDTLKEKLQCFSNNANDTL